MNIAKMDEKTLSHLRKRVFENHDMSAAKAERQSSVTSKEDFMSMVALQRTKSTLKEYYAEKSKIEQRMQKRLLNHPSSVGNILTKAPKLGTEDRAAKRRQAFELKMQKIYGANWNNNSDQNSARFRETSSERIIRNSKKNRVKHPRPFSSSIQVHHRNSVPYTTSSIHNEPILSHNIGKNQNDFRSVRRSQQLQQQQQSAEVAMQDIGGKLGSRMLVN